MPATSFTVKRAESPVEICTNDAFTEHVDGPLQALAPNAASLILERHQINLSLLIFVRRQQNAAQLKAVRGGAGDPHERYSEDSV